MSRPLAFLTASALLVGLLSATATAQSPGATNAPGASAPAIDLAHPAHIHQGLCPNPGAVAQPLNDVVQGTDEAVGQVAAVPAEVSETKVAMAFTDILAGQSSINIHKSQAESETYIACGDIGGRLLGKTDLAIRLSEQNGSSHRGAALLHDNGDGTTQVTILLTFDALVTAMPTASPAASMAPASMAPASMAPASMVPASMAPASATPASVPAASPAPTPIPVGSSAP